MPRNPAIEMQHEVQTTWEGYYLDGQSAERQRVAIRLLPHGLHAEAESGLTIEWRYMDLQQTQGGYVGEQVRLERIDETPAFLVVPDPGFLTALHNMTPERTAHFSHPAHRTRRVTYTLTLVAALATLGLLTTLYLWGIPALASLAASRVPVTWEEHLGQTVVQRLAPQERRCIDPLRVPIIESIMATLAAPLTHQPYTFRVLVVNDPSLNAFAAPGGYIIIFRGLLEHTRSAEELAGVLAHEMQHILQRHATRALLQHASTGMLLAAIRGDTGDGMRLSWESARVLGTQQYSRRIEEEADAAGMRMLLNARIDPAGMIALFTLLQEESADLPAFLSYMSTHPSPDERMQRLIALAGPRPHSTATLLPDYDWRDIDNLCHDAT